MFNRLTCCSGLCLVILATAAVPGSRSDVIVGIQQQQGVVDVVRQPDVESVRAPFSVTSPVTSDSCPSLRIRSALLAVAGVTAAALLCIAAEPLLSSSGSREPQLTDHSGVVHAEARELGQNHW